MQTTLDQISSAESLLTSYKRELDHFFSFVDAKAIDHIVEIALETPGLLIFTGVGKSGLIAEKIATTLISIGTRALYIPASNFLHGDMGIISEKESIFMFSKSGETEELLKLVPFFKGRGATTIAFVSCPESSLAKKSCYALCLPFNKEMCPFDLVPTTSTTAQLIVGDVLCMALMHKKQVSLGTYGGNHPAGNIGRKINLKVSDLMLVGEKIPQCRKEDCLEAVLEELTVKKCGAVLVLTSENRLEGIFTDGDLRRALKKYGALVLHKSMEELMHKEVTVIEKEALAIQALREMQKDPHKWVSLIPIIENRKVLGVLRMHDVIHSGLL